MTRALPEWIGATDDQAIPPRVKLRIFERQEGKCAGCGRKCTAPEFDHVLALVLGGRHAESNVQALCAFCHRLKTGNDVRAKSKSARIRAKHLGIHKAKGNWGAGRNTPFKQKVGGRVERRT